ncbi:hypothetical protein [Magnetovibrio sp.]|uniref:hypothetical protein n=1 Tax=Magnetovibrio sp. TaxID=2024836 RepID=UPI002F93FFA8
MEHFLPIMAAHLGTTALGGLYVYKRGATPVRVVAVAVWAVLFFPVAYNVVKFL